VNSTPHFPSDDGARNTNWVPRDLSRIILADIQLTAGTSSPDLKNRNAHRTSPITPESSNVEFAIPEEVKHLHALST